MRAIISLLLGGGLIFGSMFVACRSPSSVTPYYPGRDVPGTADLIVMRGVLQVAEWKHVLYMPVGVAMGIVLLFYFAGEWHAIFFDAGRVLVCFHLGMTAKDLAKASGVSPRNVRWAASILGLRLEQDRPEQHLYSSKIVQ